MKNSENWRRRLVTASGIAAAGLAFALPAMADPPVSMAPPVDGGYEQVVSQSTADNEGGGDSVFLWSEVPSGQEVTITRAVFDRGGYQLYDDVGETIVVPFSNDNLYVMKFAVSDNGHTYFVDDNGTPVLYVPRNGYLENASVNGARWYPFTQDFHPSEPVYLGVAPSWHSFVTMGWYPDMYYTGGYWCHDAYLTGGIFEPAFGLEIVIGGNHFHGWSPYHNYYYSNPAPYRVGWYNRDRYSWASQPHSNRQFWGGGGSWSRSSRPVGPSSRWETSHVGRTGGSYRVYQPEGSHSWNNNRNDQGWSGSGRQSGGGRTSNTHTWRNTTPSGSDRSNGSSGGSHTFRGGTSGWSNGGGGGSTWQGRSGGSSSGGGSRQSSGGSSWSGRSGGSSSSGGDSGHSSGGWSGGGRSESHSSSSSSRESGGGGRWSH